MWNSVKLVKDQIKIKNKKVKSGSQTLRLKIAFFKNDYVEETKVDKEKNAWASFTSSCGVLRVFVLPHQVTNSETYKLPFMCLQVYQWALMCIQSNTVCFEKLDTHHVTLELHKFKILSFRLK